MAPAGADTREDDATQPLAPNGASADSQGKQKAKKGGWTPRKAIRKASLKLRKFRREFVEFLADLWYFLTRGLVTVVFEKTLPLTSRYLSRCLRAWRAFAQLMDTLPWPLGQGCAS